MSLVGSLEDLGLADILQIVSLARKSGVLVLRGEDGEGRIVFREGLVHAAAVKGQPEDRALPPQEGAPDATRAGRAEAARREQVERAVACMFEWRSGEFSFDVRDDLDSGDAGPALDVGLSPQYLTMEATRLGDERRAGVDAPRGEEPFWFSGEAEQADDARDALVDAVLRRADAEDAVPLADVEGERAASTPEGSRGGAVRAACASAVVMDPDLAALEWLKATLEGLFERVHIFQGAEDGIARIRQYLSRGELPAVLLSDRAPVDPLSGIASAAELLRRLRIQAPRMPLLILAEEGAPIPRAARFADAVLYRPSAAALRDPRGASRVAGAAGALRSDLAPFARPRGT
jgi:hypothetical protein